MQQQTQQPVHIAIDGYSSCGKSTLAKAMASKLGFGYIDSGAMYRAVTLYFMRNGIDMHNDAEVRNALAHIAITFHRNAATGTNDTHLNGENVEQSIRMMGVNNLVSEVSAIREVRRAMVALQQKAGRGHSIVMDGRDIGTTVFPDAEVKIFMTADEEVRVQRRYLELMRKGTSATQDEIRENLAHRDHEDTHREESPLRRATDSILLDNTQMNETEQLNWALELVEKARMATASEAGTQNGPATR